MISIHIDIDGRGLLSRVSRLYGCPYGQTRFQTAVRGFLPLFVFLVGSCVTGFFLGV